MDDSSSTSGLLADEAATLALGGALAGSLTPGMVVYLDGDLGAGKTTLTRGLLRALGHTGRVKSPTYALVESYAFDGLDVHHFDLYRFNDPQEWDDSGLAELFGEHSLCLVEWPDKAQGLLPPADLTVALEVDGGQRRYRLTAHDDTGRQCLTRLSS
ncbi:tRNA (adenosine(37)-N6)-threonylcarbamoyltransferase complex ATPase subunit type 1 TsaE [Crenobacter caeni]|uniref:tRNA threonylcarbamoyladenosine biosynthesis protein TsaE n=1 Tax=Crenobacter caeni TaxID=2705474 RepID=A0A6B2KT64_9NEIS|nr:tRNA (adenosine(37)-N6)-threonylcarbamoyltransferase complex ATPase subunit type 1 TsaE [Crenobacter caeni]NDV13338.1 tRNA (adenosine(37)-N6)-threonylcarbamoyltransferase complex ATPase subunit type 1 TsaE [Crenobacter caeni]